MPRPRFVYSRLPKLTALIVCLALTSSTFATFGLAGRERSLSSNPQSQSDAIKPESGPPAASMPNLDEVRQMIHPSPQAPPEMPSTMRSVHNPLVPRNGRRVGDPLLPLSLGANTTRSIHEESVRNPSGSGLEAQQRKAE